MHPLTTHSLTPSTHSDRLLQRLKDLLLPQRRPAQINRRLVFHPRQLELDILASLLVHLFLLLDDLVEAVVPEAARRGEARGSVRGTEDADGTHVLHGELHGFGRVRDLRHSLVLVGDGGARVGIAGGSGKVDDVSLILVFFVVSS